MSTTTVTETVPVTAETLTLPINDEPQYSKVPGGWEVKFKGYKWFTGTAPNLDFVPPSDFKFPGNLSAVAINPKGPTELPQELTADYIDVSFLVSRAKQYLNVAPVQVQAFVGL
jgi:hypothetical protein